MVPEAPTKVPATTKQHVAEHQAGRRDGQAGEGVQQRNDDRHVRAAYRQHQQDARGQAQHQQQQRQRQGTGENDGDGGTHRGEQHRSP